MADRGGARDLPADVQAQEDVENALAALVTLRQENDAALRVTAPEGPYPNGTAYWYARKVKTQLDILQPEASALWHRVHALIKAGQKAATPPGEGE